MGILFPNKAVARRWDGALQARLRRAPLEAFLRTRSLVPAPPGVSQNSDNLIRATVLIVEAGLSHFFADRETDLAWRQRPVVGRLACLVSHALAQQISEPDAWRIVALVSTARLLSPWIGLNAAAIAAASAARQFQKGITKGISPLDWRIMKSACDAVGGNCSDAMARAADMIATRLNAAGPSADSVATPGWRELQHGY